MARDKEKNRAYQREWMRRWRTAHPEYTEKNRQERIELRKKVLETYGGVCACCGEARYEFLAVDHIEGRGNVHRRSLKAQGINRDMLRWYVKNNCPPGFQVLCHCCNLAKGFYGYCPHERERKAA